MKILDNVNLNARNIFMLTKQATFAGLEPASENNNSPTMAPVQHQELKQVKKSTKFRQST